MDTSYKTVPMSEDDLLDMKVDNMADAVRSLFIAHLKAAEPVKSLFFQNVHAPSPLPATGMQTDREWIGRVSVALVCAAIGRSAVRDFHELIDRDKVRRFLEAELGEASTGMMLASRAFGGVILAERASSRTAQGEGNRLSAYLADDPQAWGEKLFARVTAQPFLTMMDIAIEVSPHAARDRIILALMIVGRLSPSKYEVLRQFFIHRFGAVIVMQENLIRSTDYDETLFLEDVATVEAREETVSNTVVDAQYEGLPTWSVYYGRGVADFVRGPGAPFWSGARIRDIEVRNALSCFIAGTAIRLPCGRAIPIETASPGEQVLAGAGETGTIVAEDIGRIVSTDVFLHGINDMSPFFTSGHLIVTTGGLKAVNPALSRLNNPSLDVGKLAVGDRIIRLVSSDPFVTEEVTIGEITALPFAAGNTVYALVLDGPQTYFANSILVSANYPVITADGIADAIECLSRNERDHLNSILGPVLPLLWEALGGFAGSRLRMALQEDTQERPQ